MRSNIGAFAFGLLAATVLVAMPAFAEQDGSRDLEAADSVPNSTYAYTYSYTTTTYPSAYPTTYVTTAAPAPGVYVPLAQVAVPGTSTTTTTTYSMAPPVPVGATVTTYTAAPSVAATYPVYPVYPVYSAPAVTTYSTAPAVTTYSRPVYPAPATSTTTVYVQPKPCNPYDVARPGVNTACD